MRLKGEAIWVRTSRDRRCPVCGKPDFCSILSDGSKACCMRVESENPCSGSLGGWIHRITLDYKIPENVLQWQRKTQRTDHDFTSECKEYYSSGTAARAQLSERLGVSVGSLEELMVGSMYDEYRGRWCTTWPESRNNRSVCGLVKRYWDILPNGKDKLMKSGGSHGLYIPRSFTNNTIGPVFIPEGGSDTAALLTIGFDAVGRPSNLGGVVQLTSLLRGMPCAIIVLAENDEKKHRKGELPQCPKDCRGCTHCWPGLAARDVARRLTAALKRHVDWCFCGTSKDVRHWLNTYGNDKNKFLSHLTKYPLT